MKNISIFVALFAAMVFASCNKNEVVVIRLDETELELIKGETRQLKATVVPADASASVEWFSSMPEYVSVSETGLVKAEKIYYKNETDTEATPVSIYCRYNGGAAECEVMVLPLDVKSVSLKVMDHDMNESLRLDPQQTQMLISIIQSWSGAHRISSMFLSSRCPEPRQQRLLPIGQEARI